MHSQHNRPSVPTPQLHGVASWFDTAFIGTDQTVHLSTSPYHPLTHWYQVREVCEADCDTVMYTVMSFSGGLMVFFCADGDTTMLFARSPYPAPLQVRCLFRKPLLTRPNEQIDGFVRMQINRFQSYDVFISVSGAVCCILSVSSIR